MSVERIALLSLIAAVMLSPTGEACTAPVVSDGSKVVDLLRHDPDAARQDALAWGCETFGLLSHPPMAPRARRTT
jgi:hypothetical protein